MRGRVYSVELEPLSFDDLPLGGEWTTRRRTISESEIALFAAVAGDFSPLTVDTSGGGTRLAPPAMLVAIAVGLGSVDMPIPDISTWEWVNWTFPKPVHSGATIFARWTLTQKRPPVHGARTGIVVWRVDVHTADGAVCAEGEIGAAVLRRSAATSASTPGATPAEMVAEKPAAASRPRRRRRSSAPADAAAAVPAPPPPPPLAQAQPKPAAEKRPRRRRRGKRGGGGGGNGASAEGSAAPTSAPPPAEPQPATAPAPIAAAPAPSQGAGSGGTLSRVMRRLRGT